jgi:hypothetical protein
MPTARGIASSRLPDGTLNLGNAVWAPDGTRLLIDGWDDRNPTLNGMWTIRASDFGDLRQLTANPFGGHDVPADVSPGGDRILFSRETPDRPRGQRRALFAARRDGAGGGKSPDGGCTWGSPPGSRHAATGSPSTPAERSTSWTPNAVPSRYAS